MPIVRPLSWIVAATSVGVVILGARVVSGRRARLPDSAVPAQERPAPQTRPERPAPPSFRPARPPRPERPVTSGLAHLRGRVIAPPGTTKQELGELAVVADDGAKGYQAAINEAGEFELHLPARTYTLTATLDDLVGVRTGVRARAGAEEEVTVVLGPGAVISGVIRHPEEHEEAMTVTVKRAGTSLDAGEGSEDKGGRFEVAALVAGALYDVTVEGGARTKVIRAVTAPATLEVVLLGSITLSGSIGFAAGTRCPFGQISLKSDEDHDQAEVDRNCHFQFEGVTRGQDVVLEASGGGWHLEERVSVPAEGEPPPLCLNPPCRELPPEEKQPLEVILTGAPAETHLSVAATQDDEGGMGCSSSGTTCSLPGLVLGVPAQLTVSAPGCVTVNRQVIPMPGTSSVTIPCRRMRLVEGVARGGDARQTATVHCRQGGRAQLRANSVFEIHCPRDVTELLYRKGTHEPWRSAPLAPETDPVFVELTL